MQVDTFRVTVTFDMLAKAGSTDATAAVSQLVSAIGPSVGQWRSNQNGNVLVGEITAQVESVPETAPAPTPNVTADPAAVDTTVAAPAPAVATAA